jgi:hypothetical protein
MIGNQYDDIVINLSSDYQYKFYDFGLVTYKVIDTDTSVIEVYPYFPYLNKSTYYKLTIDKPNQIYMDGSILHVIYTGGTSSTEKDYDLSSMTPLTPYDGNPNFYSYRGINLNLISSSGKLIRA